ncbi:MAG: hypothetical protein WA803_04050 [Steroidobacteraceae bacterium]
MSRFIFASTIFVGLTLTCLLTADFDLRVIVACFAFAAFLFTLMYGVSLGKTINREPMPTRSLRVVGAILVFPLAIFGVIIIGGGIVGVFVSIRAVEMQACTGKFSIDAIVALVRLLACLLMPLAGYAILCEGLRRDPAAVKVVQRGSGRVSVISAALWFRILMFAQSIAVGTLVIAFAVAAAATNSCEASAWIWSPLVSVSVAISAAVIAAGIFALRRRRAAQKIR